MSEVICNYCNLIKNIDEFTVGQLNSKNKKCKGCVKLYNYKYNKDNAEHISQYNKKYKAENKIEIAKNKKIYDIGYKAKNKEKAREQNRVHNKNRIKIDVSFRLRMNVSKTIRLYLKNNNSSKNNNSILKFLLYTINDLKIHLENLFEPWMTWDNWGFYRKNNWNDNDQSTWTWQIDHIIPHSDFLYTSMEDENFKLCWTLSNLRPYSAKQNVLDGVNRTRHRKAA